MARAVSTPAEGEPALPALRDELVLLETAAGPDGAPAWLVHDPVQNRFIRVGGAARAMLRHAGPDAKIGRAHV